jgi:hypothetical protein
MWCLPLSIQRAEKQSYIAALLPKRIFALQAEYCLTIFVHEFVGATSVALSDGFGRSDLSQTRTINRF